MPRRPSFTKQSAQKNDGENTAAPDAGKAHQGLQIKHHIDVADYIGKSIRRYANQFDQPPSIMWIAPVVNADSSDARYSASAATSSALPMRPIG